jgi:hypothetical protein
MSRLSPDAEELVRAGRDALRPSDADRERVFQALLPQIGSGAGPIQAPSSIPPAPAATGTLVKISMVLVALGVAGGAVFLAVRTQQQAPPPKPVVNVPVTVAAAPPAPAAQLPESTQTIAPRAEPEAQRAPVAPRAADSLAQEVAILSRASAELRAGRPAAALTALDEHQRKFPRGVLTQERSSARVQALCALGRTKEAQVELARLTRASPSSPHVARARKACGLSVTEKE